MVLSACSSPPSSAMTSPVAFNAPGADRSARRNAACPGASAAPRVGTGKRAPAQERGRGGREGGRGGPDGGSARGAPGAAGGRQGTGAEPATARRTCVQPPIGRRGLVKNNAVPRALRML